MAVAKGRSAGQRSSLKPLDLGVPPRVARLRARIGVTALAVLGLGSTVGLALLIRFDLPQLRGLAAVIPLGAFVPVFAPLICREIGVARTNHGPGRHYLTASTVTGLRTVDLSKLVRIQRVIIPGKFGNSVDLLVVTDIHRVRVGLVTAAGRVAVSQALRSRGPATAPARPKITRRALRALGQGKPVSVVWDVVVPLLLMCLWVLLVSVACIPIGLA